jgi:segregation and condensation protein A
LSATTNLILNPDLDVSIEDLFSGPFDLLLHLIRKHELDLKEIPLSFITGQYLQTLKKLQEMKVDIATDFLVIATTLVKWKSDLLIPRKENSDDSEDEEDPAVILARRLIKYQRYRRAAHWLSQRITDKDRGWRRGCTINIDDKSLDNIEKVPSSELVSIYEELLARMPSYDFEDKLEGRVNLGARINWILEQLENNDKLLLEATLEKKDLESMVISFLAALELAKTGQINLHQSQNNKKIYLIKNSEYYYAS